MIRIVFHSAILISAVLLSSSCIRKVQPLTGVETAVSNIPLTALPSVSRLQRFTWSYADETFDVKGDGAVRSEAPDRARLDLFISNGFGSGAAVLLGDSLHVPGIDLIRRFLPPAPLLWGALGRLAIPAYSDTVVRMDGDSLRADFSGMETDRRVWRAHFVGGFLARLERIENERVVEWIERSRGESGALELKYLHASGRRSLRISVTETLILDSEFDESIWRIP